ncbi:CDP-alcohol phosphatidyltransferase family protein [Streptomyces calidiresistens]|uniref:CDP-alcohol phosphatidyltransferase n=1 Tax=Streptomyces calidiresistens TaxID=1485586 RepID=A0A7W3T7V0_9ACTN|nr:CDP-alcohol phosphatidyltransferase family protein [Streptomyces calidiresistens]MBB0232575.1 CDP-alcohol phosphatidyltransferase [Streptomyces calidiresistens]
MRGAGKSARGVSLYSRWVNRPLGRPAAAAALLMGLRPNHVTLISGALTCSGIAVIALMAPSPATAVAVTSLLVLGFALDSADGQLARLRREASPAGEWLDHMVDCVKVVTLHAAVLISLYRFHDLPGEGWLLVPLAFQTAAVVIFCGGLLTDKLLSAARTAGGGAGPAGREAPPPLWRALALLPVDYGVVCWSFLLLAQASWFRVGYAVLAAAHLLFAAAFALLWYRRVSALSAPRR